MNEATIESFEEKPPINWKTILVPVDLSDPSKEAIRVAVCLAEKWHGKIILLHVVELSNAGISIDSGMAVHVAMDCAQKCLDKIADGIPTTVAREKLVCLAGGDVSLKIVEMASHLSSDLIVLAAHTYCLFKGILHGSTAESVNRDAPCEVLIVHDGR